MTINQSHELKHKNNQTTQHNISYLVIIAMYHWTD